MNRILQLDSNWTLYLHTSRQIPDGFSFPVNGIPATVPGTVHTDLLAAGLIPDPFFGMNEKNLQWIGWNDWRYETVFDLPERKADNEPLYLVFEGLDTVADIFLNGTLVAKTQNMFRSYRFEISRLVKEKGNRLSIVFTSPLQFVKENRLDIRQMPSVRHPDRVFLRKAQYAFGWDWGPMYPTSGIWRPVYLTAQAGGIRHVHFDTLELNAARALVQIECDFRGTINDVQQVEFELVHGDQSFKGYLEKSQNKATGKLEIANPELWWPNGEGKPTLHHLTVRLKDGHGHVLDERQQKVGLRQVELVTSEHGQPVFYFKINGRKLFAKGADWIPADLFLPRVSKETYRQLLTKAKQANMNMMRVWGGGIYEDDYFYQLCDELGLMVWQDFMFACAAYPENETFVNEVQAELEENIGRLRAHPSIVLWCGNNENEWIWHRDMGTPTEEMPGYRLFHQKMPAWLAKLDPFRPYWPTTPWGDDPDPNSSDSGNRHAWEVWSWWQDYTSVKTDVSLFVTEFGFQAPANFYTLKKALPAEDLAVQSEAFEWHNKQEEGPERLFRFLSAHLPVKTEPQDFVYLTQLNQALALQTCLEHWRTNKITMGALIWQMNDCWPVSSWALIDSDLRAKISYHQVRRSFAPILLTFKEVKNGFELMLKTDRSAKFNGKIVLLRLDLPGGTLNTGWQKTVLQEGEQLRSLHHVTTEQTSAVWIVSAYDTSDQPVARNVYAAKPWKYLTLPSTKGEIEVKTDEKGRLRIRSNVPAFFVELRHPWLEFSDQGFTLLPGEEKVVDILNFKEGDHLSALQVVTLNKFLGK